MPRPRNGQNGELERREATVSRIRWEEPGNAWRVLLMSTGEVWTGEVGPVVPGTHLRVHGYETTHKKYGKQFKVERVDITVGEGRGMLCWLEHRIPHLGTARGQTLLDRYGEENLPLNDPAALTQVSGITTARAAEIAEAYQKHRLELPTLPQLADHGLQWGLVIRAHETYGAGLPDVLRDNPYDLIDVEGISFTIIDPVAQSLGVDPKDPRRQRAFARYVLQQEFGQGHCYMVLRDLVEQITAWDLSWSEVVENLRAEPRLKVHDEDVILLAEVDAAEHNVSSSLLAMLERKEPELAKEPELPEWLDPDQEKAARELLTKQTGILTGGPGTGKTTTLLAALTEMERRGETLKLAAPTGKAAQRMTQITGRHASTIHKLLEWSPDGWKRHATNPIEANVIVIDEASMVDILLCSSLFDALGKARLIIVGDSDQLPPIQGGQPLHDLLQVEVMPTYELHTVHRQTGDSWVCDNACKIIDGREPRLEDTHDFTFMALNDSDEIVETAIDLYREHGLTLQVLTPEHRNGAGTIRLNNAIQEALNPQGLWDDYLQAGGYKIYAGDKVIYTKNDKDTGLVNGDTGIVQKIVIRSDDISAIVKFDAKENAEREDGCFELDGPKGRPLMLAYAMTVHKSQGSEWDHVVVIADRAHWSLRRQLLYTAVTRTSNRLTILGSREAIQRAVKRPRDTHRRTLLKERMKTY